MDFVHQIYHINLKEWQVISMERNKPVSTVYQMFLIIFMRIYSAIIGDKHDRIQPLIWNSCTVSMILPNCNDPLFPARPLVITSMFGVRFKLARSNVKKLTHRFNKNRQCSKFQEVCMKTSPIHGLKFLAGLPGICLPVFLLFRDCVKTNNIE